MPNAKDLLKRLGIDRHPRLLPCGGADSIVSECPATGEPIATVRMDTAAELEAAIVRCVAVQKAWRMLPAPQRGEIVRQIGEEFRKHKNDLGELVTLEAGKIRAEGLGEIQECIDIGISPWDFRASCMETPCTASDQVIACLNSGIHLEPLVASPRLIFQPRCGRGTPCWPQRAATPHCGSQV